MYYYRLYDKQTGCYMHTGYNCRWRKDVKKELLSYHSIDHSEEEINLMRAMDIEDICDLKEFILERSTTKFNEDDL